MFSPLFNRHRYNADGSAIVDDPKLAVGNEFTDGGAVGSEWICGFLVNHEYPPGLCARVAWLSTMRGEIC